MSGKKRGTVRQLLRNLQFATFIFLSLSISSAFALDKEERNKQSKKAVNHLCAQVLKSNCDASQEDFLKEFLNDLELFSITEELEQIPGDMPAFSALPKDQFGMINWNKSVSSGIIKPLGSLHGEEEGYEGFLDNLMLFQVKVYFMADVIFPHGMHTYWVGCDSCHPEPFSKVRGENLFNMKDVMEGKYCGKCHGKVAFPPGTYKNCRRCHSITKDILGPDKESFGF
ncbi:MAG: hypothetical protein L3J28_12985 [Candidatus Polarisedimenticolaceae bacterium]|nr:hypothetical protein [Candidatus Polarisedimenticolaceae bacterium]